MAVINALEWLLQDRNQRLHALKETNAVLREFISESPYCFTAVRALCGPDLQGAMVLLYFVFSPSPVVLVPCVQAKRRWLRRVSSSTNTSFPPTLQLCVP